MDHAATAMHVVESQQHLFGDLLDEVERHALVLVPADEAEEVLTENLEDHADMCAVWSTMAEVVEEADDVGTSRMSGVRGNNALEKLDLVKRSLCVAGGRLDDLEGDMAVEALVVCKPDGGKVAPAELADDGVAAVGEGVTDVDGVIAALDIVLPVLLVLGHERVRGRVVVVGFVRHAAVTNAVLGLWLAADKQHHPAPADRPATRVANSINNSLTKQFPCYLVVTVSVPSASAVSARSQGSRKPRSRGCSGLSAVYKKQRSISTSALGTSLYPLFPLPVVGKKCVGERLYGRRRSGERERWVAERPRRHIPEQAGKPEHTRAVPPPSNLLTQLNSISHWIRPHSVICLL